MVELDCRAGEERCAFVDLVEGIRKPGQRWSAALRCLGQQRLGHGEQRFPGPGDGQNLGLGVDGAVESAFQPAGYGGAQFHTAAGCRVAAYRGSHQVSVAECIDEKSWRRVSGFAQRKAKFRQSALVPHLFQQGFQPFEKGTAEAVPAAH